LIVQADAALKELLWDGLVVLAYLAKSEMDYEMDETLNASIPC